MLNILVVEDDLMIADMAEDILVRGGYAVCGIGRTVAEAIALGRRHKPDLAVLDLRLGKGEFGTEVAAELGGVGKTAILYASGNVSQIPLTATNGIACLSKPYRSDDLLRSIELVIAIVATGIAAPPFPRGFRLLNPPARPSPEAIT